MNPEPELPIVSFREIPFHLHIYPQHLVETSIDFLSAVYRLYVQDSCVINTMVVIIVKVRLLNEIVGASSLRQRRQVTRVVRQTPQLKEY